MSIRVCKYMHTTITLQLSLNRDTFLNSSMRTILIDTRIITHMKKESIYIYVHVRAYVCVREKSASVCLDHQH